MTDKKGVQIDYATLRNPDFVTALTKLGGHSFKNSMTGYNVARLIRKHKIEAATNQDLFVKLIKRFADLDASGNFVPKKDKEGKEIFGSFNVPEEKMKDLDGAYAEFAKIEVNVPFNKISPEQLEDVGLTPMELIAIDMLLIDEEVKKVDAA